MLRSLLCPWWMVQVWVRVLNVDELLNVLREFRDRVGSLSIKYLLQYLELVTIVLRNGTPTGPGKGLGCTSVF